MTPAKAEPKSPANHVALTALAGRWNEVRRIADEQIEKSKPSNDPPAPLPTLAAMLRPAHDRACRRAAGIEKPITLPWSSIAFHFGGGLWTGVHYVIAGTGLGKTQWTLQAALHAASNGIPVAYIGLELSDFEIALRVMGIEARVPWAHLFTGTAGSRCRDDTEHAISKLESLPFHPYFGGPHGYPVDKILETGRALRANYPETDGAGSRPLLLVLDFLQIVGDATGEHTELRERIGRAAYVCRALAVECGIAVLVVSSIARAVYDLQKIGAAAGLAFDEDEGRCPINRRIRNPDALIGVGKESGEIEYSADSVSVLWRVSETQDERGVDVILATAKGRATRTTWSPLHFDGFRFTEPSDRGARVVEAWADASTERERVREEKRAAREKQGDEKLTTDAARIASFVLANPKCSVRDARAATVCNDGRRWSRAMPKLAGALVHTKAGAGLKLTIVTDRLPADVSAKIVDGGV